MRGTVHRFRDYTVYSYMAKVMYRITQAKRTSIDTATIGTAALVPRPVLALYFSMYPETSNSGKGYVLPMGNFLRQDISLMVPTLPLQVSGSELAVSVLDDRNDQLSDVQLLPPLRTREHALIVANTRPSDKLVLKLLPKTVERVRNSQIGNNICEPKVGYSQNKVSYTNSKQ